MQVNHPALKGGVVDQCSASAPGCSTKGCPRPAAWEIEVRQAGAFVHPDGTISIQEITVRIHGREVAIHEGQLLVLDHGKWRAASIAEDYAEEER